MKFPKGYGWKLRLAFGIAIWMKRLGLYPGYDAVAKWPAAKRKAIKPASWATFPPPPSVKMNRETIISRGGPLEVKWFRSTPDQAPSILFIHGGGWVVGGLDALDYLCSNLCDRLGVAVVAVDYRLAPDHKFPSGLEDCYDALKWVAAQAPGPVTVIGDSAGGNLTAALCLLARDSGGPAIAHQTLIYPSLDLTMESPSLISNADELVSRDDLAIVVKLYLGDHDPRDPLVSPIHAKNLRDLPPAFIVTADCDLLRDDGPRYAEVLRAAGVPVRYENYPDMPHAFLSQPKFCPGAAGALHDIIEEMRPYLSNQEVKKLMKYVLALKGFRLKLMYSISGLFAFFGQVPSAAKIVAAPIETRKGNRAPGWTTSPLPADVSMSYQKIAARSGPMVIKKYQPPRLNPAAPRVLFLHGGGWILGGVDTLDHLCANVSRAAQCQIYSVDYRLAPETPFPGGLEDCYDALNWLATDPSLGPMPAAGIAVIGESAGANLAAALCVLNARRGGPAIRHQTLIYPVVDATLSAPSMDGGPVGFQKKDVVQLIELYRGTAEATDPLISPLFAENLAKLPPALLISADLDPIRDDSERYAKALTAAGVSAKYINYAGMPHGFFFTPRICSAAAEGIAEMSATIVALSQGKKV